MTGLALGFGVAVLLVGAGANVWRRCRAIGLDRWLCGYLTTRSRRRAPQRGAPVHVFLCIADHFEPLHGGVDLATARARVRRWVDEYPALFARFADSDGRPPQQSFFYPAEEYEPELLFALQRLCSQGFGEIEVHLHHDDDTAERLTVQLTRFKEKLSSLHSSLGRDKDSGSVGYVFVHGNWALDNSRPDGRYCGVNNELSVLEQTGCYADMTFPSYPSATQPPTINTIYRAVDDSEKPRSHDHGTPLKVGTASPGLLMIPGPLVLDWSRKKYGFLPRIENGCLQQSQPPSNGRIDNWLRASVRVEGRPDWYFVKLHTHGAIESNADMLLGRAMVGLHEELARRALEQPSFKYHYVTAREMVNIALAAEAGVAGWRDELRNYKWAPPALAATQPRLDSSTEFVNV